MSEHPENQVKPVFGLESMIKHPAFGQGRIVAYEGGDYVIIFKGGDVKRVAFTFTNMVAAGEAGDPELDRIKLAMREVLNDYGWLDADLELGSRWAGGHLTLVPGKEDTQSKEIPIEAFFQKIIGLREKLRVLEQKINNHPKLDEKDKIELEGYITRCYGSLTTFNVLFNSKRGQFKGQSK